MSGSHNLTLQRTRLRSLFPVAHRLSVCTTGVAAGPVSFGGRRGKGLLEGGGL